MAKNILVLEISKIIKCAKILVFLPVGFLAERFQTVVKK